MPPPTTVSWRVQPYLVGLWLGCFALVLLVVGISYVMDGIKAATAITSLDKLAKLYAPYVGAIVGYTFAVTQRRRAEPNNTAMAVALVGTALWNAPIVLLMLRHLIPVACEPGQNCMRDTIPVVAAWGEYCGILAGPSLGYYFGRSK